MNKTKRPILIGVIIFSTGFIAGIDLIIVEFFNTGGFSFTIPKVLLLSILTLLAISSFIEKINKQVQVISLIALSLYGFMTYVESVYSTSLLILAVLLTYQYGFIKKYTKLKVILFFSFLLITLVTSSLVNNDHPKIIIRMLVFYTFFFSIIFIAYKGEFVRFITAEAKMKEELNVLNETLKEKDGLLKKIGTDYIDPVEAGLTAAEIKVLKTLCIYKESNNDIAKRLGKSPNTVKVQITKALNKVGADDRHQLVDLCKNYFIEN